MRFLFKDCEKIYSGNARRLLGAVNIQGAKI